MYMWIIFEIGRLKYLDIHVEKVKHKNNCNFYLHKNNCNFLLLL